MSLPFARSTRALQMDRERPALVVLVLAMLLLGLWAAWFFWAPVTLYETGQIVGATRRGTLIAAFPAQAAARLQPGQLALLRPQGKLANLRLSSGRSQGEAIPAQVMEVRNKVANGQIQADLYPMSAQEPNFSVSAAQQDPIEVTVEVEHISPAILVWRASGQAVDTPSVLLSPQAQ
jgi:hypothetical protein